MVVSLRVVHKSIRFAAKIQKEDCATRVHQDLSSKSKLMSPCLCLSPEVRQPAWPTVSGASMIIIIYAGSAFGLGPIAH